MRMTITKTHCDTRIRHEAMMCNILIVCSQLFRKKEHFKVKLHKIKHARYPARVTKWRRSDECSLSVKDILKSVFSFNGIFVFFKIALSLWRLPLIVSDELIIFFEKFYCNIGSVYTESIYNFR